jgi:hypothetical protein
MALPSLSNDSCIPPFLPESSFPYTGGFQAGRLCSNLIIPGESCCVPCPVEKWVYSEDFHRKQIIAGWLNVPALVMQVLILGTYCVLGAERSHRHFLSVGLCVSLVVLEVSFDVLFMRGSACGEGSPDGLCSGRGEG